MRGNYALIDLMRDARREILRDTVDLCATPFVTERCNSGCAARSASAAADLSPAAIASSTLRTKERTRERRALFTAVRLAILRTIFFADEVFAMGPASGRRPQRAEFIDV